MSWESKPDYCGMTGNDIPLECKSATLNKSGQYLEKHGRTGAYATTKSFGVRAAPANTYTITGDLTISTKRLGWVSAAIEGKKYALASISWSTGADAEPTLSASAAQVEDSATSGAAQVNKFEVPDFKISPDHVAQIPEFKWSGSNDFVAAFSLPTTNGANAGCELVECGGEISCSVKTNDKNGDPKWHDVTNGHIVVNITIAQYGEGVPTVTPGSGWVISSPLSSDDPDSDMPTWTMSLSRPLAKVIASRSGGSALASAALPDAAGDGGEGEDGEQR